ncbi:unnamed protein product [Oikopleura dioica]|uniref:FYVE-type domain-containing protein n=1 Tax=Oikopleura dioica TaxID=34765 RepID=E4YP24_OIKDI|nr:unnamed protein product [Oikopleura dioica]
MLGAAEDLTCLLCKNIHALPRRVKLADPDFPEDVKKSSLESFSKTTQTSEASDSEWNGLNERAKRPKRPRPNKEKTKAKKTQDLATQEPNIKKKKKVSNERAEANQNKNAKEGKIVTERKISKEEIIPRALKSLIDSEKPRKRKESKISFEESARIPTTRSSKGDKNKRKLRTRAKRKKSRPSESDKTNEGNAQQSEESDENEKEFHDEKRCFTCRKTFSRMAEDLVHVLCDSCQHWICGNCAPEAEDISANDVYTCKSCTEKREKPKLTRDESICLDELIMFCSNTWCSYELSLNDKLKGKTQPLTEKTRSSRIEQLTTLVNKHEITCTKNFKLNKRMKRNEFGRVQYVDIDKEGLDPKISGSMVSKRIHEDTMPYIKMEIVNHEYEQQAAKISSPPPPRLSQDNYDDLSDSSDEQEFSDDF